jgi:DnaJ homologue, subfamily C, member 28, conserved domain
MESWPIAERLILEAIDRGEFDDLPGAGKPLRDRGRPYEELWWVRRWLERNEAAGMFGEDEAHLREDS